MFNLIVVIKNILHVYYIRTKQIIVFLVLRYNIKYPRRQGLLKYV